MINFSFYQLQLISSHVSANKSLEGASLSWSNVRIEFENKAVQLILTDDPLPPHPLQQPLYLPYTLLSTTIAGWVVGRGQGVSNS